MTRLWRIEPFLSPQPAGDKWPTLEEMQAAVGGYVQTVPCVYGEQKAILFMDEDGKMKDYKPNIAATAILHAELQRETGGRDYRDYENDNPMECLPSGFTDMVVGTCLVWIGPVPREELD